jgi:hypothetical protein
MSHFKICWFAALILQGQYALAQPVTSDSAPVSAPAVAYRSIFDQYQAFDDQPVKPWRAANDAVEQRGGWRAYAKEARQPEVMAGEKAVPAPAPVNP